MLTLTVKSSKVSLSKTTKAVDIGQAHIKTLCLTPLLSSSADLCGRDIQISWFSLKSGVHSMTLIHVKSLWSNLDLFLVHLNCQLHFHRSSVRIFAKTEQSLQSSESQFQLLKNGTHCKDLFYLLDHSSCNLRLITLGPTLHCSIRKAHGQQLISSSYWMTFLWHSWENSTAKHLKWRRQTYSLKWNSVNLLLIFHRPHCKLSRNQKKMESLNQSKRVKRKRKPLNKLNHSYSYPMINLHRDSLGLIPTNVDNLKTLNLLCGSAVASHSMMCAVSTNKQSHLWEVKVIGLVLHCKISVNITKADVLCVLCISHSSAVFSCLSWQNISSGGTLTSWHSADWQNDSSQWLWLTSTMHLWLHTWVWNHWSSISRTIKIPISLLKCKTGLLQMMLQLLKRTRHQMWAIISSVKFSMKDYSSDCIISIVIFGDSTSLKTVQRSNNSLRLIHWIDSKKLWVVRFLQLSTPMIQLGL